MSDAEEDAYADDDYEPESPTRSQHVLSPVAAPPQEKQPLNFDSGESDDDESASEAVTPLPKSKAKRRTRPPKLFVPSGRHLMDDTPWTYTVKVEKVRMLRIPVTKSAAIHELRVFATIDRQAAQSRGSRWKQELLTGDGSYSPRRKGKKKVEYRRSGLIEEAKWVRGDGKVQWTFPMENFRRLKAYSPRIKAFVYGMGETNEDNRSRRAIENPRRQEKNGEITSFGWFFLDLRTPDLPERWVKLQNSPFGGEILISTVFSPVEKSPRNHPTSPTGSEITSRMEVSYAEPVKVKRMEPPKRDPAAPPLTMVSDEHGQYLRIGDSGNGVFVISVFIKAALNLMDVIQASMGIPSEELQQTGFWLSYSLFDVVVQTDIFFNLGVAEFPPIRDSFRVQSSLKDLAFFLESLGSITVFLCSENKVLAGAEIPFHSLLTGKLFASHTEARAAKPGDTALVEGNFAFPDFEASVVTASIDVEFVHSMEPPPRKFDDVFEEEEEKEDILSDVVAEVHQRPPEFENKAWTLDYLCLLNEIVAPFSGEGVSVELTVGEDKIHGGAVFIAFTKSQVFATCLAIRLPAHVLSAQDTAEYRVQVRCYSTHSKRTIATSAEAGKIGEHEAGHPHSVLPMLNESNEVVGECALRFTQEAIASQSQSVPSSHENQRKRRYRICLRLKSVRNMELSGEYVLQYRNPFFGSGSICSDVFAVQQKGEVKTTDFYCVFDLAKDALELKEKMQESVHVDLVSKSGERVGSSIFNLNYLFFSEEQYCCSEDACEEIFMTHSAAEAHWIEVHGDTLLPDTDKGPEAYAHSYRSCSINIPIINGNTDDESSRLGSVRVSAYMEDLGVLTEKHTAAKEAILQLPPLAVQDREQSTVQDSPPSSPKKVDRGPTTVSRHRDRLSSTVIVREAEETSRFTSPTRGSSVGDIGVDSTPPKVKEAKETQERERGDYVARIKESLEKEKSSWKQEQHLQQLQWKRRFAEMEKARMDELEEEWARREEERSVLLKAAQEEYQRLEKTLRTSLADLETRERRLSVAEAALQREQEAKRDEHEFLQRRLKSEQTHAVSLAKKQTEAYERRVTVLETQLSDAEQRTKQVESDFAEYRQQQRKLPESKMREEISALKGNVSELEKQKMAQQRACEIAEAEAAKMKTQLEEMTKLLAEEKKKHEARVVDELEKLRVKYIAREEKYVLDGDRDELRAIKKQLDDLKGIQLRTSGREEHLSGYRRSRKATSPPPRTQSHRRSRKGRSTRMVVAQQYTRSDSDSQSDQSSNDVDNWDELLFESEGEEMTSQVDPAVEHHEEESLSSLEQPPILNLPREYHGPVDSELERLTRERKLLLASGAYNADSYLVRELDRLINITRVNIEHQIS